MTSPGPSPAGAAIRVALFWLGYGVLFMGLGMILGMAPEEARMLVAGTIITVATLALTRAMTRSEGTTIAFAGARWQPGSVIKFSYGFAIGLAMVGLLLLVSRIVIGPGTMVRTPEVGTGMVALMAITFVALSAGEELGFRGYPFQRLRASFGIWPAQIVVAVAFAGYHMLMGWPLVNALIGTTAGSVLFGLATIASGGLAFPVGLHAAWNVGSWFFGTKGEAGYYRLQFGTEPSFMQGTVIYLSVMAAAGAAIIVWQRREQSENVDE